MALGVNTSTLRGLMVLPGHRNFPQELRLLKHTDMTIHWKALEEQFLMAPFNFFIQPFSGKIHFLNFIKKSWF
jgi:hypothetical protein